MYLSIYILSGISGSGKTSYFKNCFPEARLCSADSYFLDPQGNYRFDPSKQGEAHARCLRHYTGTLYRAWDGPAMGGPPAVLVVDNTNCTAVELAPYVCLANAYGLTPELITFRVDVETAIRRNQHGTPAEVIQRMAKNLEERQLPSYWRLAQMEVWG